MSAALPDWPRLMKAKLASAYVGRSETTFRNRVARGIIAKPKRDDGNVFWDRADLDDYVDRLPRDGENDNLKLVRDYTL